MNDEAAYVASELGKAEAYIKELEKKLKIAHEALYYLRESTFQGSVWKMVATEALEKIKAR